MRAYSIMVITLTSATLAVGCSALGSSLDRFSGGDAGHEVSPDTPVVCVKGKCTPCPRPFSVCGDQCVDVESDDSHCGACGTACRLGQTCNAGVCSLTCPGTQTKCGGACVELSINVKHCGTCEKSCLDGEACVAGACSVVCLAGQSLCDGRCTETMSDNKQCGECGNACETGLVCSGGECAVTCAVGETACNGTCVDRQTDESNCGKCRRKCKSNETCEAGACTLSCQAGLDEPVTDSWGYRFDGLERLAAVYGDAEAACSAIGGRLPTATELYRVSATQSSSVGQTYQTNYLWSLVPNDATRQHAVRLSDGSTTVQDLTTVLPYRCVCPGDIGAGFSGAFCNGPAGDECLRLESGNGNANIDRQDRASLSKAGAVFECAFHNAHLAAVHVLVEAIHQDAVGSNAWLHTADDASNDAGTLLRWDAAPGTAWSATPGTLGVPAGGTTLSFGPTTDLRRFRCAGPSDDAGTHPASVADEFVGASGRGLKGELVDTAPTPGATYVDAVTACWDRGGHLPTATELAELIAIGLPDGSDTWLRTADGAGYDSAVPTGLRSVLLKWVGTDPRYTYASPGSMTWGWKTDVDIPFRCVFFPVDADYAGPDDTACLGDCIKIVLPETSGATLWFDEIDRVAASWEAAADQCRKDGGRLPHERDYVEAIRHGLPNGSDAWLWTTDLGAGGGMTPAISALTVKWIGADGAFSDQLPSNASTSGFGTTLAFRCFWSNEQR